MKPIDVMIAEDYTHYRNGIAGLLSELPQLRISGTAATGRELLALVEQAVPDVVLMDISMPDMDGIEATQVLQERYPEVGVIALTMHKDSWYVAQMVQAGARGYLGKGSTEEVLARAIEEVYSGGCYFCPTSQLRLKNLVRDLLPAGQAPVKNGPVLTEEEVAFIRLTCEGFLIKEIADKLGTTKDKVKKYRTAVMEKTGSRTWADVVRFALWYDLI